MKAGSTPVAVVVMATPATRQRMFPGSEVAGASVVS
jgi:hypothetical protein